jgi:hypothetical protein
MQDTKNKGFTRFEGALGLAVVAIAVLVVLPRFHGGVVEEPALRAAIEAEELARTVGDFHRETGQWPRNDHGQIDLVRLTEPRAPRAGAARAGASSSSGVSLETAPTSWLREVPVDPWGRPYRTEVLQRDAEVPGGGAVVAIVVISAGPDGQVDTDTSDLWNRKGLKHPFDGDDEGYIIFQTPRKGAR